MNGFNKLVLYLILLSAACVKQAIKESEGEGLFLIYRGVPKVLTAKFQAWKTLKIYLEDEKSRIPESTYRLISAFNANFLVLRLGRFSKNKEFFVENITYENAGVELAVNLQDTSSNLGKVSDIGYPIFIMNKKIKQIKIYTNNSQALLTNI